MKKYNIPQIELLTVNAETDIIRTSSPLSLIQEDDGNDWNVGEAVEAKVKSLNG